MLVAGDLNTYDYSDDTVWADRALTVLARMATYGLTACGPFRPNELPRLAGCPCPDPGCRHVNTYLHESKSTSKPHQLDFFFASPALRERLTRSWADPDGSWPTHSDHRPIFATFDLD